MLNRMVIGAVLLGGLSLGGCATEDYVNKQVAGVQTQVTGLQGQVTTLQGQVKDHDAHLAALDASTREALDRANAAHKLAEGKFVYSLVLSDDMARFPTSRAVLSDEAKAKLGDLATRLKSENKNVYLEIQGYTDSQGSKASNYQLGSERAESVRRFLYDQGVALNRMASISYGPEHPAAPNTTPQGRQQNRRVVVVVLE